MSDRLVIWVAYHGEYEQRSAFAVFTTEELAQAETDDIEMMEVYDHKPRTCRHFCRLVTVQEGIAWDHFSKRVEQEWPEWVGGDWDAPISRQDTITYGPYPDNAFYVVQFHWVIVEGADETRVDAEVDRRVAELGAVWGAAPEPNPNMVLV